MDKMLLNVDAILSNYKVIRGRSTSAVLLGSAASLISKHPKLPPYQMKILSS